MAGSRATATARRHGMGQGGECSMRIEVSGAFAYPISPVRPDGSSPWAVARGSPKVMRCPSGVRMLNSLRPQGLFPGSEITGAPRPESS